MKQGFEDAFTDAQSAVITIAADLLKAGGKTADMIYIYMYQSESQIFFNGFFGSNGSIVHLNDWFTDDEINDFFDSGEEAIDTIAELCEDFDHPCPCQFKLTYNTKTGSFDADYTYDDIATTDDADLFDLFQDWKQQCAAALSQNA